MHSYNQWITPRFCLTLPIKIEQFKVENLNKPRQKTQAAIFRKGALKDAFHTEIFVSTIMLLFGNYIVCLNTISNRNILTIKHTPNHINNESIYICILSSNIRCQNAYSATVQIDTKFGISAASGLLTSLLINAHKFQGNYAQI